MIRGRQSLTSLNLNASIAPSSVLSPYFLLILMANINDISNELGLGLHPTKSTALTLSMIRTSARHGYWQQSAISLRIVVRCHSNAFLTDGGVSAEV